MSHNLPAVLVHVFMNCNCYKKFLINNFEYISKVDTQYFDHYQSRRRVFKTSGAIAYGFILKRCLVNLTTAYDGADYYMPVTQSEIGVRESVGVVCSLRANLMICSNDWDAQVAISQHCCCLLQTDGPTAQNQASSSMSELSKKIQTNWKIGQ